MSTKQIVHFIEREYRWLARCGVTIGIQNKATRHAGTVTCRECLNYMDLRDEVRDQH